jgi:hypothetical protein
MTFVQLYDSATLLGHNSKEPILIARGNQLNVDHIVWVSIYLATTYMTDNFKDHPCNIFSKNKETLLHHG